MQMLWRDADQPLALSHVHPCVIDHVPNLIHHPDLEREDKSLFQFLQALASRSGFQLRGDRRHSRLQTACGDHEWKHRRKWIPVMLLSASMILPKLGHAADMPLTTIKAFVNNLAEPEVNESRDLSVLGRLDGAHFVEAQEEWEEKIMEILVAHWQPGKNDPENLVQQLRVLSNYYSRYPEVRRLLMDLADLPWHMQYSNDRYLTEIYGTKKAVHSAMVYFDPASAAQFHFSDDCIENGPLCIASPADVLLHEFLHAHTVLSDPMRFIAQTNAEPGSYPHAHETATIEREQQLYRSMSDIDQLQRPSRSKHIGKSVSVACSICID